MVGIAMAAAPTKTAMATITRAAIATSHTVLATTPGGRLPSDGLAGNKLMVAVTGHHDSRIGVCRPHRAQQILQIFLRE